MKIHEIQSQPTTELNAALENFESEFRYPLGTDSWFRISHGDDYTRFFRAIGDPCSFIATNGSQVVGTITSTICRLRQPGGEFRRAAYLSDLKVAHPTSGPTLLRLLRAANDWTLTSPTPGFCVVMDGTTKSPANYTGRLAIPKFVELAKVVILRIPVGLLARVPCDQSQLEINVRDKEDTRELYERLTVDCFATDGGHSSTRSQMPAIGLIASNGRACGILEDTRRCKQLFRSDGTEMVSAHLSCFGFRSCDSAAALILAALRHCSSLEIPALFVCVQPEEVRPILQCSRLTDPQTVEASATVFGHSLEGPGKWSINTAEI
ncbi:hypothetical protein N9D23_10890 [Rubripirellula sp.]|nr:hypothetical protein [Rubripirellula sp.]MDF1843579.1 hypothetical protein [Rubripirellula sp.]